VKIQPQCVVTPGKQTQTGAEEDISAGKEQIIEHCVKRAA
jgi:hypothetical protein